MSLSGPIPSDIARVLRCYFCAIGGGWCVRGEFSAMKPVVPGWSPTSRLLSLSSNVPAPIREPSRNTVLLSPMLKIRTDDG